MDSPHQHAIYYMSHATQHRLWTHEEKLAEVEGKRFLRTGAYIKPMIR